MTLVEQWRGYILDPAYDPDRNTFLARFETPSDGDQEAEVYRHAVREEDRGALEAGTYLHWDFYGDPPRSDLYIPEYGKRVVTAADVAAAREEAARLKALFRLPEEEAIIASVASSQRLAGVPVTEEEVRAVWEDVRVMPIPELRDLKPLTWEKARTMGFPFNVPNGADEEE